MLMYVLTPSQSECHPLNVYSRQRRVVWVVWLDLSAAAQLITAYRKILTSKVKVINVPDIQSMPIKQTLRVCVLIYLCHHRSISCVGQQSVFLWQHRWPYPSLVSGPSCVCRAEGTARWRRSARSRLVHSYSSGLTFSPGDTCGSQM